MLTEYASTKNKLMGALCAFGMFVTGCGIFILGVFYGGWFVGIIGIIGFLIAFLGPFITYDCVVTKLETGKWD